MAQFEKSFALTSINEGSYVNDQDDLGGETYRGISRKAFPNWEGWILIDSEKNKQNFSNNLSDLADLKDAVESFYETEFWHPLNLDAFTEQTIADKVFDTAVNMGCYIAAVFLQKSLKVLNRNQVDYPDLPVTGHIGNLTLQALSKQKDTPSVLKILNSLQGARYVEICLANPTQEKFIRGWLARLTYSHS